MVPSVVVSQVIFALGTYSAHWPRGSVMDMEYHGQMQLDKLAFKDGQRDQR